MLRRPVRELQHRQHALRPPARQVDEDVRPVDAEDLALFRPLLARLGPTAGLFGRVAVEVLVGKAAHRFLELALHVVVEGVDFLAEAVGLFVLQRGGL